jgi:hypothetical protein
VNLDDRGADLSECGRYRYQLWRRWDRTKPRAVFIMLNPSTDANQDDPTIRRCIGFARRWGMGGLRVANLFCFRATEPRDLWRATDPKGPDWHQALWRAIDAPDGIHIAAWGADPRADDQAKRARTVFYEAGIPLYALALTKDGRPKHPLYVCGDAVPIVYEPARHRLTKGEPWQRPTPPQDGA